MPESPPNASKRLRVTASGRRREASPFSDESGNSEWCRVHMACLESSVGEEENREETNVIVTIEDEAPAKEGLSASGPGLGSAGKSASGSGSAIGSAGKSASGSGSAKCEDIEEEGIEKLDLRLDLELRVQEAYDIFKFVLARPANGMNATLALAKAKWVLQKMKKLDELEEQAKCKALTLLYQEAVGGRNSSSSSRGTLPSPEEPKSPRGTSPEPFLSPGSLLPKVTTTSTSSAESTVV